MLYVYRKKLKKYQRKIFFLLFFSAQKQHETGSLTRNAKSKRAVDTYRGWISKGVWNYDSA